MNRLEVRPGVHVALNLQAIAHPNGSTLDLSTRAIKQFGVLVASGKVSLSADAGLKIGAATLYGGDLLFRPSITDGTPVGINNANVQPVATVDYPFENAPIATRLQHFCYATAARIRMATAGD